MALDTDSGFGVASQVQGSCLSVISRSNGIFHQSSIQSQRSISSLHYFERLPSLKPRTFLIQIFIASVTTAT